MTEAVAWQTFKMCEVSEAIFDGPHATPKLTGEGPVFLGISSLVGGRLDISQSGHVSDEDFKKWTRRVEPRCNDLVFSYETRLGEAALIPEGLVCCLGRRMALIRPDLEVVDPRFLLYAYLGPQFQEVIRQRTVHGSTVSRIPLVEFPEFEMALPPLPEQRAIAEVLGALDDKIESNRRIWKLRLELAGSAFRRAAKEAEATTPLGELYEVGLSGVWGQDEPGGKATVATSCLRGRDLEDFVAGGVVESPVRFISEKQLSSRVFQNGEIWTAGSGSLGPSLLITEGVARLWENQLTYSNFVKRLVPIGGHDMAEVAWNSVVDTWRNDGFAAFRTGTAMPNLDPSALLAGVQVPVVANESREEIALLTNAALDPQVLMENLALARLRDALLPALLSGRIRVPVAAELVEAS